MLNSFLNLKSRSLEILHRIHANGALLEGPFAVFPVASLSTGPALADGSRDVAAFGVTTGGKPPVCVTTAVSSAEFKFMKKGQ